VRAPRQIALLIVATQFLTRLPTPAVADFQPQWLGRSLRYFPLVGAVVGLANVLVWWLCMQWLPAPVAVGLMLAASLLVTGAFHEDGFTDACDGFGGGRTAPETLAIMKDSRIGAFGAIGIFMLLGLKWVAIVQLPAACVPLVIVTAHVASRWLAISLVRWLPYVRSADGGKSQPFADGLSIGDWLLGGLLGAIPVAITAAVAGGSPVALNALGTGLAAAALTAVGCGCYFRARIGGYTGDCLGATQQLAELAVILCTLGTLRVAGHASLGTLQ
jgi:adenosylcobinamide-GDP ribazoletransferase